MRKFIIILTAFFTSQVIMAQPPAIIEEYIATYKELAISEMQRTGVPAAIKLAQGIHETSAGESELVLKSNNHFGIKCKSNWTGESVSHDDDARGECFRKYEKPEDSYRDHSDFLKNNQRYAFLFKLDPTDFEGWAKGLKKAGYATNPRYPQIIVKLIEDYNLNDYTLIALGKKERGSDERIARNDEESAIAVSNGSSEIISIDVEDEAESQYPVGEFKINDTKVVFVTKGTSYLSVANDNNIALARIFEFNEMPVQDICDRSQLIYLQRKRKTGLNEFHIVQLNETLYDIAQVEAIRMESLLMFNSLSDNQQPAPGEKLYLKNKAPKAPRLMLRTDNNIYDTKSASRRN